MAEKIWSIKEKNNRWYVDFTRYPDHDKCPSCKDIFCEAHALGMPAAIQISERELNHRLKILSSAEYPDMNFLLDLDNNFEARVFVSDEKMKAYLYVRKDARKNDELNLKLILGVIQKSGVQNVNTKQIQKTLVEFANSSNRELYIVIVEGIPPTRGADRILTPHINSPDQNDMMRIFSKLQLFFQNSTQEENPFKDPDFPLRASDTLFIVERGQVLYEITSKDNGDTGSDVYGNTLQGIPGNDPVILDLRNITHTNDNLTASTSGVLVVREVADGLMMRIIRFRDASINIVLTEDNMEVALLLRRHRGAGVPLSLKNIHEKIEEAKVTVEINDGILMEVLRTANESEEEIHFSLATGTQPVAVGSYELNWQIGFSEKNNTTAIKRKDIILSAVRFPDGRDGIDIFGEKVSTKEAYPVELPEIDEHTIEQKNEENAVIFSAKVSGELALKNNCLTICSIKKIEKEIPADAELNFPGNLIIIGNIGSKSKIKVAGDLAITGDIEDVLLQAGGSVTINGGMKGKGRGTVWANDTISTGYIENARVLASNDVNIRRHAFRCNIKTNGVLTMAKNGTLAGGFAHATKGISVYNLGSEKPIRTLVSFGQNYLIKDKIEIYENEIIKNTAEITDINATLQNSVNNSVQHLHKRKIALIKRNSALSWKIFNLKEYFESHIPSEIRVYGTVFPGVVLESHGRYYEVRQADKQVVFKFDTRNGQIICNALQKIE